MLALWSRRISQGRGPTPSKVRSCLTAASSGGAPSASGPSVLFTSTMLLKHIAQICRETGKEHMVKVHSGEGLANHSGPEPCGDLCEETDEKSVGAHVGEVLRRESC
jgi:hypothetical protein